MYWMAREPGCRPLARSHVSQPFSQSLECMTTARRGSTRTRSATATWAVIVGAVATLAGLIVRGVAASQKATLELIGEFSGSLDEQGIAAAMTLDQWGLWVLVVGAALMVIAVAVKVLRA